MTSTRALFVVFTGCLFGAIAAPCASAVPATGLPDRKAKTNSVSQKGARPALAAKLDKTDSAKHARTIDTYRLFHDPVFKMKGALDDKRTLNAYTGRQGSFTASLEQSLALPQSASEKRTAQAAGMSGMPIGLGCRDNPFKNRFGREMTACMAHPIDKSWKAKTYFSKGMSEREEQWAGGLALGYNY